MEHGHAVQLGRVLMDWTQPAFWLPVWQIIVINILLSGDNAMVIALACRTLPPRQRLWGMIVGAGAAVLLRIIFTVIVTSIMSFPLLKFIGGILLLWIAIRVVVPAVSQRSIETADNLWRAVKIIAIADVVMSLDNVIAIAAAAKGSWLLIIIGLTISIPLIVAGSAMLMALLDRLPVLAWGGAALLGWIAGEIMIEDPALAHWLGEPTRQALQYAVTGLGGPFALQYAGTDLSDLFGHGAQYIAGSLGGMFVVVTAYILARLRRSAGDSVQGEPGPIPP
jgi:YjbE family integral membrane protein